MALVRIQCLKQRVKKKSEYRKSDNNYCTRLGVINK